MEAAGIDVKYKISKGSIHGFQCLAPTSTIGVEAANLYAGVFKSHLLAKQDL